MLMCEKRVDPGDAPVLGYSKLLCVCSVAAPPEFPWSCFAGLGDSNVTRNWMQRARENRLLSPSGESLMDEREDPECSTREVGMRWMHLIYICSF